MEDLIAELYRSENQGSAERISETQRRIQNLQRQQTGWQLGLLLLNGKEANTRFHGALTLIIKINADWDDDQIGQNEQMRDHLLEALVTHYVRLATLPDARFVLQKLCSTLITFFSKADSGWVFPIRHVFTCLVGGQYHSQSNLPDMEKLVSAAKSCTSDQLTALILLLTTFAEDLGTLSTSAKEDGALQNRIAANCHDAWQLIPALSDHLLESLSTHNHVASPNPPPKSLIGLLEDLTKSIPFWAGRMRQVGRQGDEEQFHRMEASAKLCIVKLVSYIDDKTMSYPVLQLLVQLQQTCLSLVREAIKDFPMPITNSQTARSSMENLIEGEWGIDDYMYVDFLEAVFNQIDTTNPAYLHNEIYRQALLQLQQLLRCDGDAGVENLACQVALEKISEMVEGSTDWDEDPVARQLLHSIAADTCEACLVKARMPVVQMFYNDSDWEPNERARFQDFRYDVSDFFQSAFSLLGNSLIEGIVRTILQQEASSIDWSIFEAGIFGLTAFSDTMSSEPDVYDQIISAVLNSQGWSYILDATARIPDKARQTSIRFIAENVTYLQRHSDSLVLILNFLFTSLHHQASATPASRAIYTLCDSQRSTLAQGLSEFMAALETIGDLDEPERHRIYGAVATIIQALPTDDAKVEPLSRLLSSASHTFTSGELESLEPHELLNESTDTLQTLASIGKGLRTPSDLPIDLDAVAQADQTYWVSGKGALVQRNILQLYELILQNIGELADSGFVEACCDFVRCGFAEQHPSPFKFSDAVSANLVAHMITLENPNIDHTMACATSFVASVEPRTAAAYVTQVLLPVTTNQQSILREYESSGRVPNSNFPSSSLDFLSRLLGKYGEIWFQADDSESTIATAIQLALVILADQDTLPRRSAAGFFVALAEFSGPRESHRPELDLKVKSVLQRFGPPILALVLRLVGGECARSELESISDCLKRFIQKQAILTKEILREAIKDESRVMSTKALQATTMEQRKRFLAQIEGLRGARKTNEIVKDFWITCRGTGFGYVT